MSRNQISQVGLLLAIVAPFGAVAFGASVAVAQTGGVCIPPNVREEVEACQEGLERREVRAGSRAPSGVGPDQRAATETAGPEYQIDRQAEARGAQIQARQRALVEQEVTLLRRLVRNTRQTDPRRPEILLRLASTLFEFQAALNADVQSFNEPIYEHCNNHPNRTQCATQRQGQQAARDRLSEAQRDTIRAYYQLMTEHADYPRMDEVLFSLAFGLSEIREHDQAREVYLKLIQDYPTSRFVPHAYLSFGEYYFDEGDMDAALRFYNKVVEYPPENNSVYGYALYKSAWAQYNNEDFAASLRAFVQVIEFATQNESAADGGNLARKARLELIMPYARTGSPNQALRFFRRYATDEAEALRMLESLGEQYYDTGHWDETIAVYHQLMAESPNSDHLCKWQSKVTNATISKNSDRQAHVRELSRLRDIQARFVADESHPVAARNECKAETATVLLWQAVGLHREAVGADEEHPGTNNVETMRAAAALYQLILDGYPDLDELEFADIDPRDRPTRYRISYYAAELLWKMQDWQRCGPAFDQVVSLDPRGEYTADAAYAAVLCYNNLYQAQYQGREGEVRTAAPPAAAGQDASSQYAPRPLTELEAGMVRAFNRYLCFVTEASEVVTVKYRRARIYYEANHYQEAAVAFRDIAMNHPTAEQAEFAANLYLDSLNVLGTLIGNGNAACLTEMETAIPPLAQLYCATPARRQQYEDLCPVLDTIRCQLRRKQAELFERNHQFREAAGVYRDIYVEFQDCGAKDELLWNAALNLEAANLVGLAIQARQNLIRLHPDSPLAAKSVYLIGANYQSLAFYERAAEFYERFAREYPRMDGTDCSDADRAASLCPSAPDALRNATLFRMGLGDTEQAIANAELFATNYGRTRPRETAQVHFSIGSIYERTNQLDHTIRYYRHFLRDYGRTASPHQIIQANTAIGRAMWAQDDQGGAASNFRAAAAAWQRGAARRILGMEDVSQEERVAWVRQAVDATSEALFYLAEYKFQEAQAIRFPEYRGGRSLDRVNRWAQTEFIQWVQRKFAAIGAAINEYNKIATVTVEIEGTGTIDSPPWQIAAASRIGEMFDRFVQAFREAPIPAEIERDEELYGIYVTALDDASEPYLREAIDKYRFCLTTATNVRWFNQWSRACEANLNRLNPREYPMSAELRGPPDYMVEPPSRPGAEELGSGDDAQTAGGEAAATGDQS
ncbi:MAG: tetratricopeptide repeat protein [Sandaracinaceae bacterium]|nr:tetratricopeptide repeat protein [Sandaracinaceae bacterium]